MCPWFDPWRYHKPKTPPILVLGFLIFIFETCSYINRQPKRQPNYKHMKKLLFDCSCTEAWASPANWKTITGKAALKKSWYVQIRFHDPMLKEKYPNGFPFRKKLNSIPDLELRKAAVKLYLEEMPKLLEEKGYNPITKVYMKPEIKPSNKYLHPDLTTVEAIEVAWIKILEVAENNLDKKNKNPFSDVKQAKNRYVKALREIHFDQIKIKDFKLSEAKEALMYLKLPDASYNKFLSYMSKIFTELIEYGCVENNPFKLFKKRTTVKKMQDVLDDDNFANIMEFLYDHLYEFYRYGMMFHMSGARTTELFLLQKKDVDLDKQEYKILIKKGAQYIEEIKVIMLDALPYWIEIINECKNDNDYLFSKSLVPGLVPIAARQISRRWNRLVKKKYSKIYNSEITVNFYALKHLFLDKLDSQKYQLNDTPNNLAQIMASHRSANITNNVYLINKKKRDREILKSIRIKNQYNNS